MQKGYQCPLRVASDMWLAIDDTDSIKGMCTTYLATRILVDMEHVDLIGLPRLVRLNPAVPWKTRGNGAVCMRLGQGTGTPMVVGEIEGPQLLSYPRMKEEVPVEIKGRGSSLLRQWSRVEEDANPGLVLTRSRPRPSLYWQGVRRILNMGEVRTELARIGADTVTLGNGRGLIGCACSLSWKPHDRTFELLSYRHPDRWGTPRQVDKASVVRMDAVFPSTFNNIEEDAGNVAITPNTPCPVLFGIRGDDPAELIEARSMIGVDENQDCWLLFLTNQGTDDHIVSATGIMTAASSYMVEGEVSSAPRTIIGGHVIFGLRTRWENIDCAAYEPSKGFRDIVRELLPGDRIRVHGEVRAEPRTLNIEKMQVLELEPAMVKIGNPRCPNCGRSMKSAGREHGFRCRDCGTKEMKAITETVARDAKVGWYEPPVCSRRHLSKPLKRL